MYKLKMKFQQNVPTVIAKLTGPTVINGNELSYIAQNADYRIGIPAVVNPKRLEYRLPSPTPMSAFLRNRITKDQLNMVFYESINMIKLLASRNLPIANVVFHPDYIYFNPAAQNFFFLYTPLLSSGMQFEFSRYLSLILQKAVMATDADRQYLGYIFGYLRFNPNTTMEGFESFLSGNPAVKAQQPPAPAPQWNQTPQPAAPDPYAAQQPAAPEPQWNQAPQPEAPAPDPYAVQQPAVPEPQWNQEPQPEAPAPDPYAQQQADDYWNQTQYADTYGETSLLYEDESAETTVLSQFAETSVLSNAPKVFPKIIREKTGEEIVISKSVFKIGKEGIKVDHKIQNNSAISRHHATITTYNGKYFIKDNNSTNRTYLNNMELVPQQDYELQNGDSIVLADEVFKFVFE